MANKLDVDAIINMMIHSGGKNVKMKEKDISTLCKVSREIFMEQPVFLELEAPIKICGKSNSPPPLLRTKVHYAISYRVLATCLLNIFSRRCPWPVPRSSQIV